MEYDHRSITLTDYIRKNCCLTEESVKGIMWQLADALHHCMKCDVHHDDTHTANILINPDTMLVKLIDFGVTAQIKEQMNRIFSSTLYPERWQYQRQSVTCTGYGYLFTKWRKSLEEEAMVVSISELEDGMTNKWPSNGFTSACPPLICQRFPNQHLKRHV